MTRPLRILVPNFRAPDSFTDNVVHTLQAMGHEVRSMDRLAFRDRGRFQRLAIDGWSGFRPDTPTAQEKWVLEAAREWKPDLVLALTISLKAEVLADLRQAGAGAIVAWWGDTPANMRGMGLLVDGWDRIYIKDRAAVAKLAAVNLPAALMHEAANPDWHRPIPISDHPDRGSLVVAGNYYGYRQIMVGRLAHAGVELALYGSSPPRWSTKDVREGFRGRYIVKDEKSRTFHNGLACLNSTAMSEGDSLNCRAFEICGAGGLQLIEDKPSVADCYEPGTEVLAYRSVEEIVEFLARAKKEPSWATRIREAGHRRTMAEHTYEMRIGKILADLGLDRR